jgi:uncharacterized integral membrane protein
MNYTEKNRLIDKICASALMLIFIEIFFAVAHSGFNDFKWVVELPNILNIIGFGYLVISIGLFIYAYKYENTWKAIYGIEFFVLAFMTLLLPHSYVDFRYPFNRLQFIFPIAFLVYYIIKVIVIIVKAKKG